MNWKTIFNPFSKFTEIQLLIFGTVLTILGSFIGYYFGVTYDGVLDVHVYQNSFIDNVLENIINIFFLFAVLCPLGKFINPKTRIVDILNAVLISRVAIYIVALFTNNTRMEEINTRIIENIENPEKMNLQGSDMAILSAYAVVSLLMLAYFVTLLVFGFKTATNLKKWQHWLLFGIAIIFAEIISKSLVTLFNS